MMKKAEDSVSLYHEVQFPYAQGVLTGLLLTPPFPGRHPAVVLLAGSGPADRNASYLVPVRDYFARHGLAILVCDKAGLRGSSGDWRHQTFYDRVDQVRAAITFLQHRVDIHPQQIGLYGISQGAWICLLAAATNPDIPFIIPVSGPGITPLEQDAYYVEHVMRADGFSEPQIQQAVTYVHDALTLARRGAQYSEIVSHLVQPVQHEPWYHYYPIPDADMWEYFRRNAKLDYDPVEWLTQVRCPVLAIFGAADLLLPVDISVRAYQTALAQAGNGDVTIKVFPAAGHLITIPATGELASGYLELMHDTVARTASRHCAGIISLIVSRRYASRVPCVCRFCSGPRKRRCTPCRYGIVDRPENREPRTENREPSSHHPLTRSPAHPLTRSPPQRSRSLLPTAAE